MKSFARFAARLALSVAVAVPLAALDPPSRHESHTKEEKKQETRNGKSEKGAKVAPAKEKEQDTVKSKDAKQRIDHVRSRMKKRDKQIDRILNKKN